MEFIRNPQKLAFYPTGCAITIGNFDGVHLGHQKVLQQLIKSAQTLNLPTVSLIFEPQPQEFFAPTQAPVRLTRLREKLKFMPHIDKVICLHFNAKLASLSAQDFIQQVLVQGLNIKHMVIGDDFRFGKRQQGDFKILQKAGQQYHFSLEKQHTYELGEQRISSTRVREALVHGDLKMAQNLLGHPFSLCGKVRYGAQKGREIGFPTANIALHRPISPMTGVFAVRVHRIKHYPLPGVANIGTRPTIDGKRLLLEVHLFDFHETIYGHYVEVEFVEKIREERQFPSFAALKIQIEQDATLARSLLMDVTHP